MEEAQLREARAPQKPQLPPAPRESKKQVCSTRDMMALRTWDLSQWMEM